MSKIVIVGKNGAGKGTRLNKFMKGREDDYQVLAMSVLLDDVKNSNPELGARIAEIRAAGDLVPDGIIVGIILNEIEKTSKNIIFDGFPRTVEQANVMVKAGLVPDAVVEIYVDDEVVVQRAADRIICSNCKRPYTLNDYDPPKVEGICDECGAPLIKRVDDKKEVVEKRLKQYKEQTFPVISILEMAGAKVYTVDNNNGGDEVQAQFNEIMSNI